jgi:hypothetical protein
VVAVAAASNLVAKAAIVAGVGDRKLLWRIGAAFAVSVLIAAGLVLLRPGF